MRSRIVIGAAVLMLSCTMMCAGFDMKKLGSLADRIPKPTATLEKFDIKQVSLRDITFTFDIGINNPYPVDLRLDGVNLDFSVEKNRLFQTTAAKGFSVKARGKQTTSFDVTITYESIMKLIQDYASRDYLNCDTDVLIRIPVPGIIKGLPPTVDFSFKLSQKIPAIKPKVSIAHFAVTLPTEAEVKTSLENAAVEAVKKADVKKVQGMLTAMIQGKSIPAPVIRPDAIDLRFKVGFDIVMQNEAKAPLDFTSLQFNFLVNSNALVKGGTSVVQKTGTTTVLRVENEFSTKSLNPSVLNAFKTGAGTFGLSGSTMLQFPPAIINHPVQLEFREEGRFKLR
jgi:LEA14-like dessication related protein